MDPRSKCTIQVTEFVYFVNLALSKIIENIQFYRTEKLLLEDVDVDNKHISEQTFPINFQRPYNV